MPDSQGNSPQAQIADSSSTNAVSFSSARTTNRFPSSQWASAIQFVQPASMIPLPNCRMIRHNSRRMFKSGWIRLWVVATCSLLIAAVVVAAIYVWGQPVKYTFFTISIADEATAQDRTLAESMKERAITTTFTGGSQYSTVLTLESLADRGAVTQVTFQWLEPTGWPDKEHDEIDILNGREIEASEVIRRVSFHVHRAPFTLRRRLHCSCGGTFYSSTVIGCRSRVDSARIRANMMPYRSRPQR
jgi:hypothetical protein